MAFTKKTGKASWKYLQLSRRNSRCSFTRPCNFNFLALLDIRVFGRLYLWLLIGLALFLQPGCFYLATNYRFLSSQEKTARLKNLHNQARIMQQTINWLRDQIKKLIDENGTEVEDDLDEALASPDDSMVPLSLASKVPMKP